ncbi:MAG TPA: sigma factor-like helix-turn-helix DNA-binding protein, partial [Catalimonadaceae bacterium]|nr:sigma factor-like helix-turn-helix DNA-binding protein [Catalimonadaceae bacterium]
HREREVIYMRFFLELTYEEICQAMNLSYQVVMNYVHRALKALRANNLLNKILSFFPWVMIFGF